MYNIDDIKNNLKELLSDYRYEHSLMVALEAKKLAEHYQVDEDKAYVAGLIHDMAKDLDDNVNAEYIEKYKIDSSLHGKPLHGEVGYYMAKEQGYDDVICNAVRYHTLGHVDMDIYSKIVLIADKIARKNSNEIIEEERRLAYNNLDDAIRFYLIHLEERLKENGIKMHPWSSELLEKLSS